MVYRVRSPAISTGVCRLPLVFLFEEICNVLLRFRFLVAFPECVGRCRVPLQAAERRHAVQQHLCPFDAFRGHGCEVPRQLFHPSQQLTVSNRFIHQTDLGSLNPRHGRATQEDPACFLESHHVCQPPHRPWRSPSQFNLRHAETRGVGSNPEIMIEGQSESTAEYVAMECGNGGLSHAIQGRENLGNSKLVRSGLFGGKRGQFAQVAAGTECSAFSAGYDRPDVRTFLQLLYSCQKYVRQFLVDGVQDRRPLQSEPGNPVLDVEVKHSACFSWRTFAPGTWESILSRNARCFRGQSSRLRRAPRLRPAPACRRSESPRLGRVPSYPWEWRQDARY